MPMNLLLLPQMSLDPLFQSIQCGSDIDIASFLKINYPMFSYHNRCIIPKFHDQQIRPFHQKDMGIGSYKTDSVSPSDGIVQASVHLH